MSTEVVRELLGRSMSNDSESYFIYWVFWEVRSVFNFEFLKNESQGRRNFKVLSTFTISCDAPSSCLSITL